MRPNQLLLLICTCCGFAASAQSLINTTGNTVTNGGIVLEYSVGEIAVNTLTSGNSDLTQGLLQPGMKEEAPVACPAMLGDLVFYPNPTRNRSRIIGTQNWITGYMIYAADGKLVAMTPYFHQSIDLTPFAAGVYFIKFLPDCNGKYKTLKLLKQ
jgi:hypothetical protein